MVGDGVRDVVEKCGMGRRPALVAVGVGLGALLLVSLGLAMLHGAAPDPTIRALTLRDNPTAVLADTQTGRAFVATDASGTGTNGSNASGHVLVFDIASGALLHTVTVGYLPHVLTLDTHQDVVYVGSEGAATTTGGSASFGSVAALNARDGHVLRTMVVDPHPMAVGVDGRSKHLFVVSSPSGPGGAGIVSMQDVSSGRYLRVTLVGAYPAAIAVDERASRAFVANFLDDSVSILNTRSGSVVRTVRLVRPSFLPGTLARIAIDARRQRVFTLSYPPRIEGGGGSPYGALTILDERTGRVLRAAPLRDPGTTLIVDDGTGRVVVHDAAGIQTLDAATGRVLQTVALSVMPMEMAIDPRTWHAVIINGRGFVRTQDAWEWIPSWLRQHIPFLPPVDRRLHAVDGGVRIVALPHP